MMDDAWVVAHDLNSGAELWAEAVPADTGDWTPWIGGARDGKVYVSGTNMGLMGKMFGGNVAEVMGTVSQQQQSFIAFAL